MGFSSGASSKRRKALKAAAEQYYKAFSKLSEVANPERVQATTAREVEAVVGDDSSFKVRKLAKDSDRAARQFNADKSFKEKAAAYNDRYAILKEQMANRGAVRYSLADSRVGGDPNQKASSPAMVTASLGAATRLSEAKYDSDKKYFSSREGLLAEAQAKADAYNAANKAAARQPFAPAFVPAQASDFIQETTFKPFGVLYRNLGVAESAAADLDRLGSAVSSSTGGQALERYAAITEKLKPVVAKEASRAVMDRQTPGLIGEQLLSDLDTGVLK